MTSTVPDWGSDEHLQLELHHLERGASEGEEHVGLAAFPFRFTADEPALVLARATEVLRAAINALLRGWDPATEEVPAEIPSWFRNACAPEGESTDEHWSLLAWLWWADPDQRQWFWWDARVVAARVGEVELEITGWPYPSEALRWLLTASGATDIREHG